MNPLADNVFQMTNAELIGLAKNRFLDYKTQDKIALNPIDELTCILLITLACAQPPATSCGTRKVM